MVRLDNKDAIVMRSSAISTGTAMADKNKYTGTGIPDQPWVDVTRLAGKDRIYVGINDTSPSPQEARLMFSVDSGVRWNTSATDDADPTTLLSLDPGMRNHTPVRVATSRAGTLGAGKTVYAAWERQTGIRGVDDPGSGTVLNKADIFGQVRVARDDGANTFHALVGAGGKNIFATSTDANKTFVLPESGAKFDDGGTNLGKQRLGSDLSIAVSPKDDKKVFVAWAQVDTKGGPSFVYASSSVDGGTNWRTPVKVSASAAALPALAVADNGVVGVLYTALTGKTDTNAGTLETHFAMSFNELTSAPLAIHDKILAKFANGSPAQDNTKSLNYIGDYEDVVALGDTFYGSFAASNDPQENNFPQGAFFQRNWSTGTQDFNGGPIAGNSNMLIDATVSIDPYYFSVDAVPEPGILLSAASLVLLLVRRPRAG
jgi:hypothetical protein